MAIAITTAQRRMLETAAGAEDGVVYLKDGFERRTAQLLHDMGLGTKGGNQFEINTDGRAEVNRQQNQGEPGCQGEPG